jgi:cytochrome c2
MKLLHYLPYLMLVMVLSCDSNKKESHYAVRTLDKQSNNQEHPGKKLMETNCYVCHSPTASHDDRIGPPMIAIKRHYIDSNTSKEDFVASMQAWIKNPNEADAKMKGAVRRFGVMPKTPYPEATIEKIAEYMYDFEIDQPDWFEDHFNEMTPGGKQRGKGQGRGQGQGMGNRHGANQAQQQTKSYEDLGLEYAMSTKAILGKNLMGQIQKNGTEAAVDFCNIKAIHLTDSMAKAYNASIKRVTDKPRNPDNSATKEELKYLANYKDVVANNEEPEAIVIESETDVRFYYPITTNAMCLQCHGKPDQDIAPKTLLTLKQRYPADQATGYGLNEVRGIWSIKFSKESE